MNGADMHEAASTAVEQPSGLLPPLEVGDDELRQGVAGILFVADEPISAGALAETLGVPVGRIDTALAGLAGRLDRDGDGVGIELVEVAGGWRLMTAPAARTVLERWIVGARHGRLTQAALETLAVVAYRQPIARATIGEIRGVNPDGALRSLVARGLVAEVGREDGPGQAVLFGTTVQFLERMGLRTLSDLPPLPPYLPDGPAPDEPDAGGLAELRKRLRDGSQRLGSSNAGSVQQDARLAAAGAMSDDDDDDDGVPMPPPAPRGRRSEDGAIIDLSERLEQAARSAMGRLRHVKATQARAEAEADAAESARAVDDDGADVDAGAAAPDGAPTDG